MNRRLGLGLLLAVAAGALALRGPSLDRRPMHNDEGLNAIKLQGLWEHGRYTYDPKEFHGPTLYYATLPFVWLSGARDFDHLSETTLRWVTVAFGVGLVLLVGLMADGLGWRATLAAAALTAASPAMVFYSRYFIHEMLLVFFTALVLAAGWRYVRTRRVGWALLAGAGLGLMYATKETFVLAVAAMTGAAVSTWAWNHWARNGMCKSASSGGDAADEDVRAPAAPFDRRWLRHGLAALAVAAVVSIVLFTSFFQNPGGPLDSVRAYFTWLQRAGGESPHIHPWSFYLERLFWFHPAKSPVWSEGLIAALAVVGAVAAFAGRGMGGACPALGRFLAFYTLGLAVVYSVIAYKTTWCLLGFLHPMILLAGLGLVAVVHLLKQHWQRVVAAFLLVAATAHLGWQAYRASYLFAADKRNPYVYAQTVPNLLELVERMHGLARVHPDHYQMVVKVMSPESYSPLPWYLRQFKRVGWWDEVPADSYAPVVIASATLGAALDEKSQKRWLMAGMYELRPRVFLELYVEFELWRKYVATLPRERD